MTTPSDEPQHRETWSQHSTKIVEAPYDYISSLPSKGVRDTFIDALGVWFEVPEEKLLMIKDAITILHNCSLIMDDFQDNSPLRRGMPATHTIFGPGQSLNTATHGIIKAIHSMQGLVDHEGASQVMEMIMNMFRGQAMDLFWTANSVCPSVTEYHEMINDKTGALFQLGYYLVLVNSDSPVTEELEERVRRLITLWGRYFQTRDDYMNLCSADYTNQKGFCEDLDEGKYSLPLIHAIQNGHDNMLLNSLLALRRTQGCLTHKQKVIVLEHIKAARGFEWTELILRDTYEQILVDIKSLEKDFGKDNLHLRRLAEGLRV
ncbi:geranylgeranyl diphosphate synthase [Diaporthe sp. PMI_573]|nr:geranylgeranyl diphosphate synthase [Diaporthaceae sp. PMI_573]